MIEMDAAKLESTSKKTLQSVTNEYKFIPDIHFAGYNSPCMRDCSFEMNSAVGNCRRIVHGYIGRTIARSDRTGSVVSR
jgi:hypothetical protein